MQNCTAKGSYEKRVQAVLVRIHQQVHSVAHIELAINGREMIAQRVQADVQGRGDHLARRAFMFDDRYNDCALLLSQSSDARVARVDLLLRAASTKGLNHPRRSGPIEPKLTTVHKLDRFQNHVRGIRFVYHTPCTLEDGALVQFGLPSQALRCR